MTKQHQPDWLEPDEHEVSRWTAAVPFKGGRGAKYGGTMVLTDRRLAWLPLQVSAVVLAGVTPLPITVGGRHWEVRLTELERAVADRQKRALLHLVGRHGDGWQFLVGAGRFAPIWSKKNQAACADAAERITAAARHR